MRASVLPGRSGESPAASSNPAGRVASAAASRQTITIPAAENAPRTLED
ncbi:MAG TPA: hypothetical protein VN893_07090 [Bryobacteraceae bacterium]|nr:hypothetical protein [Bryobacteraceae bacterium]